MTADVELLPLPELPRQVEGYSSDYWEASQVEEYATDYARACVAHATAAKDAEIEALRAEVERLTRCLANANAGFEEFERRWYLEQDRAERLAEALRGAMDAAEEAAFEHWLSDTSPSGDVEQVQRQWEASADFAGFLEEWEEARAALHPTAAQEGSHE